MVFLIIILLCVLWLGIATYFEQIDAFDLSYTGGQAVSLIIGMVFLVIGVGVGIAGYGYQIYDIENYHATNKKIEIYQEKANVLGTEFTKILGEDYNAHETGLFEGMTPDDIQLLLIQYPQIKASATSMNLVENILYLNNEIYSEKIKIIDIVRDLNYRKKSPWYMGFMIPKVPDNIE